MARKAEEVVEPKPGAVAYCGRGYLGLIVGGPSRDGVWWGVYLDTYDGGAKQPGMKWQSKEPRVVAESVRSLLVGGDSGGSDGVAR